MSVQDKGALAASAEDGADDEGEDLVEGENLRNLEVTCCPQNKIVRGQCHPENFVTVVLGDFRCPHFSMLSRRQLAIRSMPIVSLSLIRVQTFVLEALF